MPSLLFSFVLLGYIITDLGFEETYFFGFGGTLVVLQFRGYRLFYVLGYKVSSLFYLSCFCVNYLFFMVYLGTVDHKDPLLSNLMSICFQNIVFFVHLCRFSPKYEIILRQS